MIKKLKQRKSFKKSRCFLFFHKWRMSKLYTEKCLKCGKTRDCYLY